jgi:AcrR family transcriptional regulator
MSKRKPVRAVAAAVAPERDPRPPVEAIRAAAFAQFAERGYPVVTVRDIMKACGLTQGALYNHFKSKDELLHDIIASTQGELERLCQQAVAGAGDDPRAKLAAFVRVYVMRHCRLRVEALVANREISWLDAERVADIRRSRRAIRDIVVTILTQGVARGVFDPPQIDGRRDLKAIAMALLDQCTHVSMWYGPGGELGEEQMAKLYADMALRAVGARAQ